MKLKDVLAMEVPSGALRQLIKNEEIEAKASTIEELADIVSTKIPGKGQQLADEYQYAGQTAVNIHVAMKGIPSIWLSKEYFKDFLIQKYTGAIFAGGIRPSLGNVPQLFRAAELGDRIILAFSYLGQARRLLVNFEVVIQSPQIVEYVVVYFSPFALEIRSAQTQNELFKNAVLDIMGIKEEIAWEKITKLQEAQASELARRLGARLRAAKHKMTKGVFATKEVTARPEVEDLETADEYKLEFMDQPMKSKTLVFTYEYQFGYQEEVSFSITENGLWFRSRVGEEVIRHVMDEIFKIKYPTEDQENIDIEEIPSEDLV